MAAALYLIGNLESRRTRFFVESIKRSGLKWRIISWESVLSGEGDWAAGIEPGSTIRIDSPGQNFAVEKALLKLGFPLRRPPSAALAQISRRPALREGPYSRAEPVVSRLAKGAVRDRRALA